MLRHTFICFFGLLSVLLMLLSPAPLFVAWEYRVEKAAGAR